MWDAAVYPAAGTGNDGKIVLVGYDYVTPSKSDLMVVRYNPNGALDSDIWRRGNRGRRFRQ